MERKKLSSSYELAPAITIQVNGDNEIHFFDAEPTLAMIQSGAAYDLEKSLNMIMSSSLSFFNPQDHIRAHEDDYEKILKYSGEEVLQYMLNQFEQGKGEV